MNEKGSEDGLLGELELTGYSADAVAGYFENMIGGVKLDGSPECYYMLGVVAGFKLARHIDSDFTSMAIVGSAKVEAHK